MSSCRTDNNLLSLSVESILCIVNEFRVLDEVSAKYFYREILTAVKEAISDEKTECLMHLSILLSEISETKNDECLQNYQYSDQTENFNLVSFACKNKAVEALYYIFSEEPQTLYNLSVKLTGVCKNELLFSITDEFRHNAFFYAMRSNMPILLHILVKKCQSKYSDEELDDLLSQSYKELKLRNVSLTREMQLFVQSKILDLRFLHTSVAGNTETGNSWDQIKKRIELVVRYIQSIKKDYWHQDPDDKCILIAEFIAKNIYVLKSLLKSTYDRFPWEEIEFCLIIFIRCCKNPSEPNLVYNCVLNKKKLLLHLFNFSIALDTQRDEFKNNDVKQLVKKVNLPRDRVIDKITKKNSEFCELYDDYEKVRDFCSLEIIESYANLIESSDNIEKRRHLLVSRVLQIMGEHLKNTLESPKLSTTTASALLSPLPFKTREIITKLRDALSHDDALFIRAEIEKKSYLLKKLQTDISKIKVMITKMLYLLRIESVKYMMNKIRLLKSFKDISELYGPFQTSINLHKEEIDETVFSTSFKGDFKRLEELIFCLQKNLNDQTLSEMSLFREIFHLLQKEKSIFEDLNRTFMLNNKLRNFVYNLNQEQSKLSSFIIPLLADLCAEHEIPELPLEVTSRIKILVRELLLSVCSRIVPSRNLEVDFIIWNISEFMNFQMGTVKWMEEFRETIRGNKIPINHTLSANLLTLKLSQLKETLTDFDLSDRTSIADFSAFEGDMELRAVTEMLVLDILGILESSCSRNPFFLDSDYLVLAGKNLRNHLAHGNILIDVCLEESSAQLLANAKKLLTEEFSEEKKLDKVIKCDCIKLESTIEQDLRIISNQLKLFVALEEGNVKDAEEGVNEGADVDGKDSNLSTCLHFAGKAPDCAALKWILKKGLDIHSKDRSDQTVLHIAAKFNSIQVFRYLIEEKNMSINISEVNGKTPLHVAAENHSNEVVKYISNLSLRTEKKDHIGCTPLHSAIRMNNTDGAKILLEKEENVDENKSFRNFTALHIATHRENLKLVKSLIEKNASVKSKEDFGHTPLHTAMFTGNIKIVKYLILNHADVNVRSETGCTSLRLAVLMGNKKIVKFLLKHQADINVSDDNGITALMTASYLGHALIAKLLLQVGAHANTRSYSGTTSLHLAAKGGYYKIVKSILKHNADVNCKTDKNVTALHLSCLFGHNEVAKLLIIKGADINATESTNSTPLHYAVVGGHKDIVDLLIDNGAVINCKDETGSTALHFAASNANRGLVEYLLKKGADIRVIDEDGITPLDHLIRMGLSDLITPEGKDVNPSDLTGSTLLHVAAFWGDQMLVEYCIENCCDITARNINGSTALHLAAEGNHPNIISFLLSKGMEIDAKDGNGETPLLLAAKCNFSETAKVLVSHDMNSFKNISDDKIEALQHSVESGYYNIVDILLESYKFDISPKFKRKLLYTAVRKNLKHVVTTLLKRGFEINDDAKPLHVAVRHSHYHMAELLLTKGANPNLLDKDKCTPLDISVKMRDSEMIEILLSEKADMRIKSKFILSAAEYAVRTNQSDIIKLLLQMKVIKANAKGNSGNTFLHSAAKCGSLDVAKYLVAEGADINAKDKKNRKSIHIAAEKGFRDMVEFYLNSNDFGYELPELLLISASHGKENVCELLLERRVDVNSCHKNEETPLKSALVKGHKEVLSVLLHYGAYYNVHPTLLLKRTEDNEVASVLRKVEKVFTAVNNNASAKLKTLLKGERDSKYCIANAKCVIRDTALHHASSRGYKKIVDILLNYEANPNARTKSGETPLHYAVKYSHFGIVKSLLSNGAMYNSISISGKTPLDYATDLEIRDFLFFLNNVFRQVQENDISVLGNLRGKDEDTMRSVVRAENNEGKTLIEVAHICDFSETMELQLLFETNPEYDVRSAQKFFSENRYTEAILTLENLIKRRVKVFGADSHPVLDIKFELAFYYNCAFKTEKAIRLSREVQEARKKSLGEDHQLTLLAESCIASFLSKQGKNQEALKIYETIRFKLKQKPEAHDVNVMTNEIFLMIELYKMKKFDKALKIIIELEDNYDVEDSQEEDYFFPTFPQFRYFKALIYRGQGKYSEALKIFTDEYQSRKNILSPHHPKTLEALFLVSDVLCQQKKYDESLEIRRKVLDIQKSNLSENHIDILKSEFFIGDVLMRQEMLVAALKIFSSLEPRIAAFGPDNEVMKANKARIEDIKHGFSFLNIERTFERIQNDIRQTEQSQANYLF